MKCIRHGCLADALLYAKYRTLGNKHACSMYCRDLVDLQIQHDEKVATLNLRIYELQVQLQDLLNRVKI